MSRGTSESLEISMYCSKTKCAPKHSQIKDANAITIMSSGGKDSYRHKKSPNEFLFRHSRIPTNSGTPPFIFEKRDLIEFEEPNPQFRGSKL